MDVKAVISVVLLAAVALGVTFWLGGGGSSGENERPPRLSGMDDDRDAPPLDEEGPRPKAETDSTLHDFGSMQVEEFGKHTFVITNAGEDTLVIAKGASTCKCTVSELPNNEIPPGETAEVILEWQPKGITRTFSQSARIWTNDAERRAIDFRIEGEVTSLVNLIPGTSVNAGNILEDSGAETRLRIFSQLTDDLTEPEILYAGDYLTFETEPIPDGELQDLDGSKAGYDVNIQVSPKVPVGKHKEVFEVEMTVDGKEIHREITVTCHRKGPIDIFPAPGTVYLERIGLVDFQRFPAKKGKKQTVTVMIDDPPDGEEIELSVAENELPEMKISIEPNDNLALNKRQAFNVTFEIPPGLPPLDFARGNAVKVTLDATHPLVNEIVLHVELHSN